MLKKLGLVELHGAIKTKVEAKTGLRCYDTVPDNMPPPFYFVQIVGKRPENTKTMWCEVFSVWLHVIAQKGDGSVVIYQLIQQLEESLTERIILPEYVELLLQTEQGLQTLKEDETGEYHAIIAYDFKVAYGFKAKI